MLPELLFDEPGLQVCNKNWSIYLGELIKLVYHACLNIGISKRPLGIFSPRHNE